MDLNNKPDSNGRTPIFYTVINGDKEAFIALLEHKPEINYKDKQGWSLLHVAAQYYQVEIAGLLIANGADIEARDNYGNTPLWRAVFASQGKAEIIELLLKHSANQHSKNSSGISPLELANKIANYDIKEFFKS